MKYITFIFVSFLISFSYLFSQTENLSKKDYSIQLYENLEILSGSLLYQIYLNIDIMNNNSDVEENYEMFDNFLFILEAQLKQLKNIIEDNIESRFIVKEKINRMEKIVDLTIMVQEDIDLFRTFLIDNSDNNYSNFFKHHKKVYKIINKEFEIEEMIRENSNGEY